jgi:cellulose synthase/poly-beta-1,6-N-acetylglucosamine synthase-like glycosyltransferase
MFLFLLHIVFAVFFIYLAVITLYFLLVSIAGRASNGYIYSPFPEKKKIAVLIPSYKEDNIIISTASKALQQDYPENSFDVFVIADKLQKQTIDEMRALPVNVIEVEFDISMKAKSIHEAMNQIEDSKYDVVMVLDADNVMSPGCLEKVNHAFQRGFKAVQCHRVAKNKNNAVAILDVVSEEINNNLFRRGQRALGFSSSLIGSGMAFEFEEFKKIFNLPHILDNPGEDREIELQLMKDGIVVEFIDSALVYDEKVSSAVVFEKQRLRWLEAQLNNIKRFFDGDIRVLKGSKTYWYKLFQTILLPRSLYLLLFAFIFFIFFVQYFVHYQIFFPSFVWWAALLGTYIFALIISVPAKFFNSDMLKAIIHLPVLMIAMIKALFKMKSNRKEFLHTPKVHTGDS